MDTLEIGQRIRTARQEAGLSQRQLCGDQITRNMLSQIENGGAVPSLQTLQYLADRLQRPVGWFFGDQKVSDREPVDQAWTLYQEGNTQEAARILSGCPEETLYSFQDVPVLKTLILLSLAEQAIEGNRQPYAQQMLDWVEQTDCGIPALRRQAILLQGRLENQNAPAVCDQLPSLDQELLLRAEAALQQGDGKRAGILLDAAQQQSSEQWLMLRGRVCLSSGDFREAAGYFHQAERNLPDRTAPYLEQCYRELGDFRQAYLYACRQK